MEGGKKGATVFHIFVDLQNAFDRVPRETIVWTLRKENVPERLITLMMTLYVNSRSKVKALPGTSEEFEIGVGVHQGSALSPLLFVVVMQEVKKDVRGESLGIVICRRPSDHSTVRGAGCEEVQ